MTLIHSIFFNWRYFLSIENFRQSLHICGVMDGIIGKLKVSVLQEKKKCTGKADKWEGTVYCNHLSASVINIFNKYLTLVLLTYNFIQVCLSIYGSSIKVIKYGNKVD